MAEESLRMRIWDTFESPGKTKYGSYVTMTMLSVIVYSSVVMALQTMPELDDVSFRVWQYSDLICTVIFTIEYLTRLVACPSTKFLKYDFLITPMNVIDVVAILPFYVQLAQDGGLASNRADFEGSGTGAFRVLRVIRLARVFRVLKAGRYSTHLNVFFKTYQNSSGALVAMLFIFGLLAVFFASAVYEFEKDKQPEKFFSIPNTIWWCFITMTTVGYGDMAPITTEGRILASIAMILGTLSIALPVTVVGAESVKQYDEMVQRKRLAALKRGRQSKLLSVQEVNDGQLLSPQQNDDSLEEEKPTVRLQWGGLGRLKAWIVLDGPDEDQITEYPFLSMGYNVFSFFMACVILLSAANIILASMPSMDHVDDSVWSTIEAVCIGLFTFEYVSRWIVVPEVSTDGTSKYLSRLGGFGRFLGAKWRFMVTPFSVIDLIAIVPFYIDLAKGGSSGSSGPWAALRVMRLVRLVRVFKLGSYTAIINVLLDSFRYSTPAVGMLLVFLFAYLLLFGSLIYECEKDDNPDNFKSVPGSFWWAISTVTTVGYGDVYPVTDCGKVVACAAAILGVVGITLPLAIIGVFFAELSSKAQTAVAMERAATDDEATLIRDEQELRSELRDVMLAVAQKYPRFRVETGNVIVERIQTKTQADGELEDAAL